MFGRNVPGHSSFFFCCFSAYSAQYPSEVPPISNNTPVPSDINRTVEEKSEDDSSTPYGTPPTSDVDMAAAATDVAKLQADVAALAISGTTSTALATGDGTHFNDPADKNYGRRYTILHAGIHMEEREGSIPEHESITQKYETAPNSESSVIHTLGLHTSPP